jgi:PAS domain S-box-containing protein
MTTEYFPQIEQASPDIAEQPRLMDSIRQLRRQLGETSSRWNELVSGAAEAICVVGLDGALAFANARWRDLLGVEGNELVGGAIDKIVHPDDRQHAREMLGSAFHGARVSGLSCRLRHRGGAWREALLSISPVRDEAGAIVGVLGICRDVTEEREARRLKDEFLSSASHELRTPITTIRGLTDLLLHTLGTHGTIEPAQLAKRLQSIRREADRLAVLSTDLLDVSRLQVGKLPLHLEHHDLNEIMAACVERLQDLLGDVPTHEIVFRPRSAALPVGVERVRIEQVVYNLLDNAVKYSPMGGPIDLTTEIVGKWAHASFADRGIGIPAEDIPKLFTPFFRGSNASSRSFMGMGIGLYLSRALVEAQGGKLLVQSIEGQGSTFTIVLPLHSDERE